MRRRNFRISDIKDDIHSLKSTPSHLRYHSTFGATRPRKRSDQPSHHHAQQHTTPVLHLRRQSREWTTTRVVLRVAQGNHSPANIQCIPVGYQDLLAFQWNVSALALASESEPSDSESQFGTCVKKTLTR